MCGFMQTRRRAVDDCTATILSLTLVIIVGYVKCSHRQDACGRDNGDCFIGSTALNTTTIALALAALITSVISGIIGMGGGILLLAVMLSFLDHGQAIPLHAVVQLCSNTTRSIAFWKSADLRAVRRFVLGMIPGAVVGTLALSWIGRIETGEPYLKMLVGLYVLVAPFVPKGKSQDSTPHETSLKGFFSIGFLAGAMALTIGAVGPLIAPIFSRHGYVKERLIATKAICQSLTHLIKLPAFLILGTFSGIATGTLSLIMIAAVIPGTLLGKHLLKYVSPSLFVWMFKISLVVAGLKVLIVDGIMKLNIN